MEKALNRIAAKKLFAWVIAVPLAVTAIALGAYWIGLPNQATVRSAENLGQIFKEYESKNAITLPKDSGSIPPLLSCAICDGESSTKCALEMATHVSQKISGQHHQNYFSYVLESLFLGGAIWLRYDHEQIERLYLGVYSSYKDYHGFESVCDGLFHKSCNNLSQEDVVYLDAWIRGRDWNLTRLKENHAEFANRLSHLAETCNH